MSKKIGIIGLGLIGASLAKAFHKYTEHEILAWDIQENICKQAYEEKVIHKILEKKDYANLDLLILAVRPEIAVSFIKNNPNIRGIVLDICGIKKYITKELKPLSEAYPFQYIGAHPMAGREVGGYKNSFEDLYKNASILITTPEEKVPHWLKESFKNIGFSIKYTDDENHDRIIAYTSQLAHVASNAFVKSPTALEHSGYSAGSLKDLTRVATLDVDMWTELFLKNKENLITELEQYIKELEKYKLALKIEDTEELKRLLQEGRDIKALMYPKK